MYTLIKQWLDGKKEWYSSEGNTPIRIALEELETDLPSLLEQIKEGLLKEVGNTDELFRPSGGELTPKDELTKYEKGIYAERSRTRQIITKFLSINK